MLAIVQNGQPCLPLANLTTKISDRNQSYTRHFTVANYKYHNISNYQNYFAGLVCYFQRVLVNIHGFQPDLVVEVDKQNLLKLMKSEKDIFKM